MAVQSTKGNPYQRLVEYLGLQGNFNKDITPVVDVTPSTLPVNQVPATSTVTNTGSSTIFTVPNTGDWYLTSLFLARTSDATADSTSSSLSVVFDGGTRILINLRKQTLTAGNDHHYQNYNPPIKLDRGSAITLARGFTVGAESHFVAITGSWNR